MRVDPEEASALCDAPSGVLRYAADSPPPGQRRHGPSEICKTDPLSEGSHNACRQNCRKPPSQAV